MFRSEPRMKLQRIASARHYHARRPCQLVPRPWRAHITGELTADACCALAIYDSRIYAEDLAKLLGAREHARAATTHGILAVRG
jgi:hypothetical protein